MTNGGPAVWRSNTVGRRVIWVRFRPTLRTAVEGSWNDLAEPLTMVCITPACSRTRRGIGPANRVRVAASIMCNRTVGPGCGLLRRRQGYGDVSVIRTRQCCRNGVFCCCKPFLIRQGRYGRKSSSASTQASDRTPSRLLHEPQNGRPLASKLAKLRQSRREPLPQRQLRQRRIPPRRRKTERRTALFNGPNACSPLRVFSKPAAEGRPRIEAALTHVQTGFILFHLTTAGSSDPAGSGRAPRPRRKLQAVPQNLAGPRGKNF